MPLCKMYSYKRSARFLSRNGWISDSRFHSLNQFVIKDFSQLDLFSKNPTNGVKYDRFGRWLE
jgi:hypothetical protein